MHDTNPSHRVAFIGAGDMGRPMIEHLHRAGHHVTVYARRAEVRDELAAAGLSVGNSPAHVVGTAEFVFVNVTATQDVEQVLFGTDGVASAARPGAIVIDHSTISAAATREFAQRLAERGVELLDAPVSGGESGAKAATLAIMVGGSEAAFARARPMLELFGRFVTHIGGSGAGQVAKACNQIVQVVNIEGIAEAMRFANAQGVDAGRVLAALQAGFAGSKMLDLMGPKMVARDFSAGIQARLHDKDFGIVCEAARALGVDLPAVQVVAHQLESLVEAGWGRDDTSSLLRVLEEEQDAARTGK